MRACLGCARPVAKGNRCTKCKRENARRRKAEGKTGERGSTHASRKRRERVLKRANHVCFYCGAPADREDHYVPLARGGSDAEENCLACCAPCNSAKSDLMPATFIESDWLANRRREIASTNG